MEKSIALAQTIRRELGWDQTDTLQTLITYLEEEVAELKYEIETNGPLENLTNELADVFLVALSFAHDLKVSPYEILLHKKPKIIAKYGNG